MWVSYSWPWYWLVWPWWRGRMYRIVTGVTSDVGVPSTYLVRVWMMVTDNTHHLFRKWLGTWIFHFRPQCVKWSLSPTAFNVPSDGQSLTTINSTKTMIRKWWMLTHWRLVTHTVMYIYRYTSNISRTLIDNRIVDHSDVVSALPQLHLHSRLDTCLQWIGQKQLQDEMRNI